MNPNETRDNSFYSVSFVAFSLLESDPSLLVEPLDRPPGTLVWSRGERF